MDPMNSGHPKIALITGAGHGIGAATARKLAGDGWTCVCADIEKESAERVAAEIAGHAETCDVSSEVDIKRLIEESSAVLGRIDAVISNAGIMQRAPLRETSLDDWNKVIATNLTAAFLLAKYAEPHLRQARGSIVLTASTRAHMSEADTFAYSASKGGLVA